MAVDDAATTAEDTAVSIAVLANDSDLDGDTLSVSGVGTAAHGTAAVERGRDDHLHAGGELQRRRTASPTRSSDGHGGTATATVTVTVTAVNDAPVAVDDAATTAEDTPVSDRGAGQRQRPGRRHAGGERRRHAGARHGAVERGRDDHLHAGGELQRRRTASPTRSSDGHGGSATATVSVTVTAANDAPVAVDDAATTAEDTPVSIAVLANDTDLDGDTLR